jgi:REP element-mobilizing transposase RayT
MPRSARAQSESGIYHVMIRGINQTQLFFDDEDYEAFIERLARYKEECRFSLLAYSLMGNHVHLVIQEDDIKLPVIIKKLALSYSHWFNTKYDRNGYLFQGRYKSEPVTSDEYLLSVIRYVHNNPVKVGLPVTWWSSYRDYTDKPQLTDTDTVLSMFAINTKQAQAAFGKFMQADQEFSYVHLDDSAPKQTSDSKAIALILEVSGLKNCVDLALADKTERNRVLNILQGKGLSIRQLSRLTGISRGVVYKALSR